MISIHQFPCLRSQRRLIGFREYSVSIIVNNGALVSENPVHSNRDGAKLFPRKLRQLSQDFR